MMPAQRTTKRAAALLLDLKGRTYDEAYGGPSDGRRFAVAKGARRSAVYPSVGVACRAHLSQLVLTSWGLRSGGLLALPARSSPPPPARAPPGAAEGPELQPLDLELRPRDRTSTKEQRRNE